MPSIYSQISLLIACCAVADAGESSWISLRPPVNADPKEISSYVSEVRRLVSPPPPATMQTGARRLAALSLEPGVGQKAAEALSAIPLQRIDILLAECVKSEKEVAAETRMFTLNVGGELKSVEGTTRELPARTAFTRVALSFLVRLPDIPVPARSVLFEYWDTFPELVAAVSRRSWLQEGEAHLSTRLLRKLDRETGWWNTSPFWLQYLARLNTPRAWQGLEYLMVEARPEIQVQAYEIVRALPDVKLDLDATVRKAWRNYVRRFSGTKYPIRYARIAAQHGVVDAMLVLARSIRDPSMTGSPERDGPVLVAILAPDVGDVTAAADFAMANAKRLKWNSAARNYSVR